MKLTPSAPSFAKACSRLASVFVVLLMIAPASRAHDIDVTGVARLFLDEHAENTAESEFGYSLSIVDAKVPPLFNIDNVLPERCSGLKPTASSYRFSCNPALSSDDTLLFPWPLAGAVLVANWRDGSSHSSYFRGDGVFIEVSLAEVRAPSAALGRLALRYFELGIEHIMFGFDHLLFVVGLMLLLGGANPARSGSTLLRGKNKTARYLKTITAFTLAHSVTLAAASLGFVSLPIAPVEILIALSIVLLAREALLAQRGHFTLSYQYPWIVAFIFGLIHGLGFASALGNLGLNPGDVPAALLFFNLGVEAGQLAIIFVSLTLARLLFASADRLSKIGVLTSPSVAAMTPISTLSYLLGGVATYWLIERLPSLWVQ